MLFKPLNECSKLSFPVALSSRLVTKLGEVMSLTPLTKFLFFAEARTQIKPNRLEALMFLFNGIGMVDGGSRDKVAKCSRL